MTTQNITYEIILQEDEETGDLFMPLPEELLQKVGWKIGDELIWKKSEGDSWILMKK